MMDYGPCTCTVQRGTSCCAVVWRGAGIPDRNKAPVEPCLLPPTPLSRGACDGSGPRPKGHGCVPRATSAVAGP